MTVDEEKSSFEALSIISFRSQEKSMLRMKWISEKQLEYFVSSISLKIGHQKAISNGELVKELSYMSVSIG
jgi:hypothetical protein